MTRNLDQIDNKILAELSANSRIPIATLAERVHLSRNAVRVRIERLEREHFILQYTIVQESEKNNREDKFIAMVFIHRHDRMRGAGVLQELRKIPEISECHVISGRFDLFARVEASTAEQLRKVCQDIWKINGVADTETRFILSSPIQSN
jgi:DNA-binding Lrp family transcriptional regulator